MTESLEAVERRIRALERRWVRALGLGEWRIETVFDGPPLGEHDVDPGTVTCMEASCDWRYQLATIRIDRRAALERDEDEIEEQYVHELCHLLLRELRVTYDRQNPAAKALSEEQIDHEEHVATALARALIASRAAGRREGALPSRRQLGAGGRRRGRP